MKIEVNVCQRMLFAKFGIREIDVSREEPGVNVFEVDYAVLRYFTSFS